MSRCLRICVVIRVLSILSLSSLFFTLPTLASDEPELSDRPFGTPRYESLRPQWGIEVSTSLKAFGGVGLVAAQGSVPFYAINVQADYQPVFLQVLGVIDLGLSAGIYPLFGTSVTASPFSLWAFGGQIRYQARYFHNQFIVPVATYGFEYLNYQFTGGPTGSLISSGPTVGLWLLLNSIDSSTAGQFYISTGILRSYLVAEARFLSGGDSNINFSGASYYFGLRFEF